MFIIGRLQQQGVPWQVILSGWINSVTLGNPGELIWVD